MKIDRSLVRDIVTDPEDASIVEAIIAWSHSLGKAVVAEGVETIEQQQFLYDQGCEFIQGYRYSTPVTTREFA